MPHVHQPAPGLTLALGCNGRGIALCTSLGQQLATSLCDSRADFAYPVSPLQKLPMHGLQRFYIGAGVAWYSLLDRLNVS
jgi:glycine/D-amino acid oxidase-like deaminating enzyme